MIATTGIRVKKDKRNEHLQSINYCNFSMLGLMLSVLRACHYLLLLLHEMQTAFVVVVVIVVIVTQ